MITRIWKDIWKYKWAIVGFAIYYLISHHFWGAYCPMLLVTGLPCPGCGMSRAIFFVLTMQFSRAWAMNPIAFLWVLIIFRFLLLRYVLGKSVKKLQLLLIIILFATIGYYMYRMVAVFPSFPPMVYRNQNVFATIFPEYEKLIKLFLY
jgi:hypothetical protein